jgi:hypothetical protein
MPKYEIDTITTLKILDFYAQQIVDNHCNHKCLLCNKRTLCMFIVNFSKNF